MKIIADENIVGLSDWFAGLGELRALPGRAIGPEDVKDADALLVRSVTRVDAALLEDSAVRYVGTATSGLDHVDTGYLAARGIALRDAAGANANSVVEYVFCALAALRERRGLRWREGSFGIIGAGHIGGRLARVLESLGIPHLIHDPFLPAAAFPQRLRGLEEVLAQDILSVHTPLTHGGPHPTFHLFDRDRIEALRPGQILINAARGAVVDNGALLARLRRAGDIPCVLDAWENEPAVDLALLGLVDIATPHIAGYSLDGKLGGTALIWRGLCETFGLDARPPAHAEDGQGGLDLGSVPPGQEAEALDRCLLAAYDIRADDARMRETASNPDPARQFDLLRKHYPVRREFGNFRIESPEGELARTLRALGFVVEPESWRSPAGRRPLG